MAMITNTAQKPIEYFPHLSIRIFESHLHFLLMKFEHLKFLYFELKHYFEAPTIFPARIYLIYW